MLLIDLPLFLASSCSISGFYLTAQRALYPKSWTRKIVYLPFVMAVGIGLSVRNAKAVLEAIFGVQSEFARTPKYRIEGHAGTWRRKGYRNRAGWMPFIEVAWDSTSRSRSTTPFRTKTISPRLSCCFLFGAICIPA